MNWTLAGLVLVPIAVGVGQLIFKRSSQTVGTLSLSNIVALFWNPWFLLALTLYGAATVAWIFVLRGVDVSRAYQFMALTYLAVPIGAWMVFGEAITSRQLLGMTIVFVGIIVTHS